MPLTEPPSPLRSSRSLCHHSSFRRTPHAAPHSHSPSRSCRMLEGSLPPCAPWCLPRRRGVPPQSEVRNSFSSLYVHWCVPKIYIAFMGNWPRRSQEAIKMTRNIIRLSTVLFHWYTFARFKSFTCIIFFQSLQKHWFKNLRIIWARRNLKDHM